MPRDKQAEAIDFATDARSVIEYAKNKLDVGGMSLPDFIREVEHALGLLGRAQRLAREAEADKTQLKLDV